MIIPHASIFNIMFIYFESAVNDCKSRVQSLVCMYDIPSMNQTVLIRYELNADCVSVCRVFIYSNGIRGGYSQKQAFLSSLWEWKSVEEQAGCLRHGSS